jgi:hypothetical protein
VAVKHQNIVALAFFLLHQLLNAVINAAKRVTIASTLNVPAFISDGGRDRRI